MKGILNGKRIEIIAEDDLENRFLNVVNDYGYFYIRTEKSILFQVNIIKENSQIIEDKKRLLELYYKSESEGLNLLDFQEGVKLLQKITKEKVGIQ